MLFNTYGFIFAFLPIVFIVYYSLIKFKLITLSRVWLAASSVFFYSWWNIYNLPIIALSITFNFIIGSFLARYRQKSLLIIAIIVNLLALIYYKYFDFFIQNINDLLHNDFNLINIILPLGISFFTFTQITYLVDAYRGESKEYNIINYVLFVTFFPHLIAGPILHHKQMMPQFSYLRNKVLNWGNISHGIFLFSLGLAKKVIIADTLATWANPGFSAQSLSMLEAWVTAVSYTFQLYFDFSGYTDMALGIALLFNIKLPQNFNSPYKADSIIDFWRRWHMTLSQFLREYIYIPLGGNRKGKIRRHANLMITMLIGGLWHGAAWTFVFWGFLHGTALVINHLWRTMGFKMNTYMARIVTFVFVVISWVFFRAETFDQALIILKGMFNFQYVGIWVNQATFLLPYGRKEALILILIYLFVVLWKNSMEYDHKFIIGWKGALIVPAFFVISLLMFNRISEFLYFQF